MPRYEFVEGSSSKFWEISLEGASFTTTYGRIGTDGQMSLKECGSEEKAKKEYEKLIAEKVKKGYRLIDGDGGGAPAKAAPLPPPKAASAKAAPAASAKAASAKAAKKPVFDDEGDDEDEEEAPPKPKAASKAAAPAAPTAKPAAPPKSSKTDEAGKRYFEFVDGSSSKFWEIELDGTSFTTRYGKIGTDGQLSMKECGTEDKAQREYEKLVAEKVKKGYVEK